MGRPEKQRHCCHRHARTQRTITGPTVTCFLLVFSYVCLLGFLTLSVWPVCLEYPICMVCLRVHGDFRSLDFERKSPVSTRVAYCGNCAWWCKDTNLIRQVTLCAFVQVKAIVTFVRLFQNVAITSNPRHGNGDRHIHEFARKVIDRPFRVSHICKRGLTAGAQI